VKTSVKTKNYSISGKDGAALLAQMDRRGPKHGFLTRAIAQTSYSVNWEIDWTRKNNVCRVKRAVATLSITYTYPEATGALSSQLKQRWARFMKGVRKHEEMHGTLATQMVKAADKAIAGFAMKNDPGCRKAQAAVKERVDEIYALYEAKQHRFDQAEHQSGGAVDSLVRALGR
jgi:predicted secreted Zn-dependent protease